MLDLMLPGLDGLEVCRQVKNDQTTRHIPIVMLTAKGEEVDIVTGLELGADDYITKPFSPRVLVARIRAVLRRGSREIEEESEIVKIHDLSIHPGRHEVMLGDKPLEFTITEFRILHFLTSRKGWVYTRNQIVDIVHGDDYPVTERSIDVHKMYISRDFGKNWAARANI